MRSLTTFTLILATTTVAFGQTDSTDSLPQILPATKAESTSLQAPADVEFAEVDAEWAIEIVPLGGPMMENPLAQSYAAAYAAIPFSRAEWLANPSYRHDSAMALVTGQPINGRTAPNRNLEEYQSPRRYRRTFFPRLAPADLQYQYMYRIGPARFYPFGGIFGPWGWGF